MADDPYDHALHRRMALKLGLIDDDILLKLKTGTPMHHVLRVLWRNLVFALYGPWRMSTHSTFPDKAVADVQLGGFKAKIFCEIKDFKVIYQRWWVRSAHARLYSFSCRIDGMPPSPFREQLESPVELPTYSSPRLTKAKEEYILLCCYLDSMIAKVAKANPDALAEFKKSMINC